ncbi:MAG: bifunctional tetrahydrofolate synthase/dihydrofolate synthase [Stenotrophobium sp.]
MLPQTQWTLADWLRWQENLHPRAIAMGLERVGEVAARMGLPDARIRTLTIAGTNGKGSSATLAAGIYRAAGYRVGLYTSPHLRRYNERIAIDGTEAADAELFRAFLAVEQARADISLTYFEFGTLAALWLFREARVDMQVLEVGLGGRLDAVNLVDTDCALITNIGLDHTDWLGPDRESIGHEKAGILRAGRPAICVDREPPASVTRHAQELGITLMRIGHEFNFTSGDGRWSWRGGEEVMPNLPMPGLRGVTQLRNAAGVIAATAALNSTLPVTPDAIRKALPALRLPGRFQRIGDVILDVGHNAEAAAVLADNLRAERIVGRVLLVLGMLTDKPVEAFAHALAPVVHGVFAAGLAGPRGQSAEALALRLRSIGLHCTEHAEIIDAYAAARGTARAEDVIVVTGSFLSVAAVAEVLDG